VNDQDRYVGIGTQRAKGFAMIPTALQQLVIAAFGDPSQPLACWFTEPLLRSAPLQQFVASNAKKIRKKVRHAQDAQSMRDIQCELAVAMVLVDRRSQLIYEPLAATSQRGPDFLLCHKGHTNLYVEVSRIRRSGTELRNTSERLAAILCGKLEQFASGAANILVLISDSHSYLADEIATTIRQLQQRADAADDAYFAFRGLSSARTFHQTMPRLSALYIATPATATDTWYFAKQARFQLPADLRRSTTKWDVSKKIGPSAG
jgi:hypothetical protein